MDPTVSGHKMDAGIPHAVPQSRIMGIRWQDRVRNTTATEAIGLPPVSDIIDTRRSALFGHMVRLGERTPTHCALKLAFGICHG